MPNILQLLPEIESEELELIKELAKNFDDAQAQQFASMYRTKRKDSQTVMLLTLIGFVAVSGVQRFYLEQIGMGLLYLFTAGLCFIGTIVDLVKHRKLTLEYNLKVAQQVVAMMGAAR
jgi:TM2 domain-containing membrane protein YozV